MAAQLEELYQYVVSAKIYVKLRTEILDGLEKVRQAIHDYHISGGQGLKKAFSVLAVAAATNEKNDSQDECTDSEQEGWHKRLWQFVDHLGKVLTIAINLHALSAPLQKILEASLNLGH